MSTQVLDTLSVPNLLYHHLLYQGSLFIHWISRLLVRIQTTKKRVPLSSASHVQNSVSRIDRYAWWASHKGHKEMDEVSEPENDTSPCA